MPELPEVETMRRGIAPVVGGRIVSAERVPCRRKPISIRPRIDCFGRRTRGAKILATDRIGKRVVLRLDTDDVIVFEPRMTGLVLLAEPPDASYLRFRLGLVGVKAGELLYWDRRGLGNVRLYESRELAAAFGPSRLGPDALVITAEQLRSRLAGCRRAIKVALLDQSVVAGIGNLYAAEILHVAGIHPDSRCCELSLVRWRRIVAATRAVLEQAIRYEGSTLSDGTYRNALNRDGTFQNHHRVYAKTDESCRTCGRGKIRRIVQAQRATFFCPWCQRRVRRPAREIRVEGQQRVDRVGDTA